MIRTRIRKGQIITAALLDRHDAAIYALEERIHPPQQINKGIPADNGVTQPGETVTNTADEIWTEYSRTTETVRVENPDDATQYVDVDRIVTVTFAKPDGTTVLLSFSS